MANLFDVYNDGLSIDHTEGAKLETGETPITISGLTADTTYDKVQVAFAGSYNKSDVPSFKTKPGGNLLFNSAFLNGFRSWNNENNLWTIDGSTYQGNPVVKSPATTSIGSRIVQRITNPPVSGSKVTVSFNARGNDSDSIILVTLFNTPTVTLPLSSSFSRYTVTFTIPINFGTPQLYFWNAAEGNNVFLNSIKLERGNKATDWIPAPEDSAT